MNKVNSLQKRIAKRKQMEDSLQKEKEDLTDQYFNCLNNNSIIIGLWNDKEKKIEFAEDIFKKMERMEDEIQKLKNRNRIE